MTSSHPEHALRCPWCGAPPKQRCASPRGRKLAIPSHDARLQAWANQQAATDPTYRTQETA